MYLAQPLPDDRDPCAIYANNELDLDEIDVYGFDYDYTLASYTPALHYLIYNLGRDRLINENKVPRSRFKDFVKLRCILSLKNLLSK